MDLHVKTVAFEEQNQDVVGTQLRLAIADVHANAIHQVIAVRLDNQLPLLRSQLAEQAPYSRLCPRMQVTLGLLKQQHVAPLRTKQFGDQWQRLSHTVTHVCKVP